MIKHMLAEDLRKEFPILSETVYGKPLVYLDNAATSQRPSSVIRKWDEMSEKRNSNLHRAVHHLAALATECYEGTRDAVKDFIGAESREEIIFTSGTTASINLAAFCIGESFIEPGDEIIIAESEHHSDIVPWQMMCKRKGATIKVLPVTEDGYLDIDALPALISDRTKLVCVAHISNVLGIINPVKQIVNTCHSRGCMVLVDGAQGILHQAVDVRDLGCDFYAFSGHKMFAAPGTGILYGRRQLLDQMPPYMGGGEMIDHVSFKETTYAPLPQKYEAGTQNIAGVPTLKPAIKLVKQLNDSQIQAEMAEVRDYVLQSLISDRRIRLYGVPRRTSDKIGLFSFTVEGIHHEDLALILDKMGVAVRSGQMCAEPLMDRYGVTGMLRASFAPYNTLAEAEYFIHCLDRAIKMLS